MEKKFIIAGNWKMFGTQDSAKSYLETMVSSNIANELSDYTQIILFPPYTLLPLFQEKLTSQTNLYYGAQDCDTELEFGAQTGQISAKMLEDLNCRYVILGHSERRQRGETSEQVKDKSSAASQAGLTPIICIGENEEQRKSGQTFDILKDQLDRSLDLSLDKFIIAYEPVWAIGTGLTPTLEQIQETHAWIRSYLPQEKANTALLYGGSVKKDNISEIASLQDVGGVLVGGASLDVDHFKEIIVRSKQSVEKKIKVC